MKVLSPPLHNQNVPGPSASIDRSLSPYETTTRDLFPTLFLQANIIPILHAHKAAPRAHVAHVTDLPQPLHTPSRGTREELPILSRPQLEGNIPTGIVSSRLAVALLIGVRDTSRRQHVLSSLRQLSPTDVMGAKKSKRDIACP